MHLPNFTVNDTVFILLENEITEAVIEKVFITITPLTQLTTYKLRDLDQYEESYLYSSKEELASTWLKQHHISPKELLLSKN